MNVSLVENVIKKMASKTMKFFNKNNKLFNYLYKSSISRSFSAKYTPVVQKNVPTLSHYKKCNLSQISQFSLVSNRNDEEEEKERQRKEQEKMDEEELKKREAAWKTLKYTMLGFGGTFSVLGTWLVYELGRPSMDENGQDIRDEFSDLPLVKQYFSRLWNQLNIYKKMIQEPSREKLLPDPVVYPYIQPPYTLVLELRDLLVHPEWTYETGWRFKKRPGVDYLFDQVGSPKFEIVVYTAEPGVLVFPILDSLDTKGHIMYRLVRDSTHFVDGHHVKDLSRLNRDLSRVIVVDWNASSVNMHRNNALIIPRWKGNDDDTALVDLAAFLKTIFDMGIEDVRSTLEYYSQFDDPLFAFQENRRKLAEKLEEEQQQAATKKGAWAPSFLKKKLQPT